MYNLGIRRLLIITAGIHLLLVLLIGSGEFGFEIPVLRQLVGFVYLTFIPGLLLLRIIRPGSLGRIETLLFSVALSVVFLMGCGLLLNSIGTLVPLPGPISTWPLVVWLTVGIGALAAVAYRKCRGAVVLSIPKPNAKNLLQPQYTVFVLLPVIAIVGALMVNRYDDNRLLLLLMPLLAVIPIAAIFLKHFSNKIFPVAIVMISLALAYQYTLIGPGLNGWDIHQEHFLQNLVITTGLWDMTIPHTINSMLSIVMLGPVYAIMLDVESIWLLKAVYPLLFSLVPLGLYQLLRHQLDDKRAFLAVFFFMSVYGFVADLMSLPRQQIAEMFFVCVVLLLADRKLELKQKRPLLYIFAIAVPLSHYGLSVIAAGLFAAGWVFLLLMNSRRVKVYRKKLVGRFGLQPGAELLPDDRFAAKSGLNVWLVLLFGGFSLAWFAFTSSGLIFNSIASIMGSIFEGILYFGSGAREAVVATSLGFDWGSASALGKSFRVLQYLTQLFIIVGLVRVVLRPRIFRFKAEFLALTLAAGLLLVAAMVLPAFSGFFNLTRFYHVGLFFLAPFFIIGGEAVFTCAVSAWRALPIKRAYTLRSSPVTLVYPLLVLIIILPYFLFNTGFIFELSGQDYVYGDFPASNSLSMGKYDQPVRNQQEMAAVAWFRHKPDADLLFSHPESQLIFSDYFSRMALMGTVFYQSRHLPAPFENMPAYIPVGSLVLLRTWNLEKGEVAIWETGNIQPRVVYRSMKAPPMRWVDNSNLIYNNGNAQVLMRK